MKRRNFLGAAATIVAIAPLAALAQQRLPRVGVIAIGGVATPKSLSIVEELARLGYVDGRNIAFEIRTAGGDLDRLRSMSSELVATKPDVIVCASGVVARLLAEATREIPIITTITTDPVELGLSDSMSRPSRNVTGFTSSSPSLAAKRLEILRELIPHLRKAAYLGSPPGLDHDLSEKHTRSAAAGFGIELISIPISSADSVADAFKVVDREKAEAVLVGVTPANFRASGHIIDECQVRNLPAVHPWPFEIRAGALMSYGPNSLENHAGAARYVDRVLKGAKISELPFEEPTEFRLAINMRTARSMKIAVPPTLLARADEVIE